MLAQADDEPVPVEADADRIGQVVANYLTNALKYSPADRSVEVSVAVDASAEGPTAMGGGWVRVAVRDQGPGIPEVERAQVWELFHRAPGSRRRAAAWGWGCTSARQSSRPMAGRSGSRVQSEWALPSGSPCLSLMCSQPRLSSMRLLPDIVIGLSNREWKDDRSPAVDSEQVLPLLLRPAHLLGKEDSPSPA